MAPVNNLPELKRFVTTHDLNGLAIFSKTVSEDNAFNLLPNGDAAFALGYTTKGFPVDLNEEQDIDLYKQDLESPPGLVVSGGTVLRFVDLRPGSISPMHRTVSLDYGVVLEGEADLILDSGEVRRMKRGDVAVQRGTMHMWKNASDTKWVRMMYVLQASKPLEVDGKALTENYGPGPGMDGVPKSS